MQALLRLSNAIDALIEGLGKLSTLLVTVLIFVGFYSVAARYIGREIGRTLTSNGIFEVQWYIFAVLYLVGFAYILKHNINVRVDFLYSKWTPRRKALVNLLGTLLLLIPFCILAIYVSINPILSSWGRLPSGEWGRWEVSPDPSGLPRAPIKTMIIVGFALLLLQAISQAIKYAAIVTSTVRPDEVPGVKEYEQVAVE
jgi:TRAP-type mannitol/chloroaromatic compound transport system permease small subunit